jgi:uncharacterized protein (DUF1778 family)
LRRKEDLMATSTGPGRHGQARERKTVRMELRLAPSAKQVIQRAMSATGLAAGDLAYEGARRMLEEHERMILTGADREAFLDALRSPPEPAAALVAALKRHRELFG